MAKHVAIKAKRIGAAFEKVKPSRPLCNQRDEQCSNKNAERRAPAQGKARIIKMMIIVIHLRGARAAYRQFILGRKLDVHERFTCEGRPALPHISSYNLPQELRLIPSDAESKDLCWKNLRIENKFTDFSLEAKHLTKTILLSVTGKLPTSSPLLPNYS